MPRNANQILYRVHMSPSHIQTHYIVGIAATLTFVIGELCLAATVSLISIIILKQHLQEKVELSFSYSYRYYGIRWGISTLGLAAVPCVLGFDIYIINDLRGRYFYFAILAVLTVGILPATPTAIYFAWKTKAPAVPYIFVIPVALLFCCCNTQRAKSLVLGIALWINLLGVSLLACHGGMIVLALVVEPVTVMSNTLIVALFLFCVSNILALLLTISAYVFTPRQQRPRRGKNTIVRSVVLIMLLALVGCFFAPISLLGYYNNLGTYENDFIAFITSAVIPVFAAWSCYVLFKEINLEMVG